MAMYAKRGTLFRPKQTCLLISIAYRPNVGGIETHFDDLVQALTSRSWRVWVLTYQPIETKAQGKWVEEDEGFSIYRLPIIRGFFYKLVKKPLLEFLYLSPGLFLATLIFLLVKGVDISVIHAQGLIAGFVGVFWGKIFKKRVVVSTHSIYQFPKAGFYRSFAKWIFNTADFCLGLSKQAAAEIASLGIPNHKVGTFTYWVNQKRFRKINKNAAKKILNWTGKFVVLFVGRLIEEKGVRELLRATKLLKSGVTIAIAGNGPLEEEVKTAVKKNKNIIFLGKIDNERLPIYYSAADASIVPSTHEEGFGRVILESLACGTPVIGAKRGAIPEAMDETVGGVIDVTPENIKKAVEFFYKNPERLKELSINARKFAERRYSEKNVEVIIKAYETKA
jgi:glycosyltransferase involved in cell wall biosynthesis